MPKYKSLTINILNKTLIETCSILIQKLFGFGTTSHKILRGYYQAKNSSSMVTSFFPSKPQLPFPAFCLDFPNNLLPIQRLEYRV
jgi:hypothetical protein